MPETKYNRDTQRFDCLGLDLNRPVDSVKPGKFPYLKNCRSNVAGRVEPREGMTLVGTPVPGQAPLHSCRRLNDPANDRWAYVIGSGTHLAVGDESFSDVDSGYSGEPLALVPWRPEASPTSYMYVADSWRMRKVTAGGDLDTIGYPPPPDPPRVGLRPAPLYKVVEEFEATAGWVAGGSPVMAAPAVTFRTAAAASATVTRIAYDSGATGWATVALDSMAGVTYGERLQIGPETVTVEAVYPGSATTTVALVIYDAGASGPAAMVLTTPIEELQVGALLFNSTLGESARIDAVLRGPDEHRSLRLSTPTTWGTGHIVELVPALRAYLAGSYGAGTAATALAIGSGMTGAGTGTLTKAVALNLAAYSATEPIHPDDYMVVAVKLSAPLAITEIKVQLDVDAAVNDFTRNYYTRTFRPSDLSAALAHLQAMTATQATIAQHQVLDASQQVYGTTSGAGAQGTQAREGLLPAAITTPSSAPQIGSQELESGTNVWVPLRFRIADLVRVGTDDTRTLAHVAAIQVVVIATAAVNIEVDSWWIGGGFGPDVAVETAIPYLYRYRVRNPQTNVASNWSPASREGVSALRQGILVSPPHYTVPEGTSLTETALVLDIQRFGGELAVWHYVGTTPNSAFPSFLDKYPDDVLANLPISEQDAWQLWPIIGTPVEGMTGAVAGTSVQDAGSGFDLRWAPGTPISIDGIAHTIYRVISTSLLETVESAGTHTTGVPWRVPEPVLQGQPLQCLWGDEQLGALFACGDPLNPGRLYFSNGNDADTTKERNYLDVTSASEPLMNGVVFNMRSYVFSSERMFQIRASGDIVSPWIAEEIPNGKGLFSPWAINRTPSPMMVMLAKDGIFATTGGAPHPLSEQDLYPTFPHEGRPGLPINGVLPPDITPERAPTLRLDYADEFVYFDYYEWVTGGRVAFVLDMHRGGPADGWFWDVYIPNILFHYGEEGPSVHGLLMGGADGNLYRYGGDTDAGNAFSMEISTPSRDQGDPRTNKLYGDIMLDADTEGVWITATPYVNNNQTALPATTFATAERLLTGIPCGSVWQSARNIALNLVGLIRTAARPKFYIWEPRWALDSAPMAAKDWEISASSLGMSGWKHMGLVRIAHLSSAPLSLTVTLDGVAQPAIAIAASPTSVTQSVLRVPVYKFKLLKVRLSSTADFRLDTRDSFFQIKEWGSEGPYHEMRLLGDYALVEG
ncbi:MAG TPA: hypothetical protein VFC19_22475 [Candidatus Limnocylindrales bacterium]|nr:hypothetical protein [Candidatus Limnocylindrales bacterium]